MSQFSRSLHAKLTLACGLFVFNSVALAQLDDLKELKVTDTVSGHGPKAKAGDYITVLYVGRFANGEVFDGNMDEKLAPDLSKSTFTFKLGDKQVISGWEDGLMGAQMGAVRKLDIPWSMGYGEAGVGPIKPKTDLFFTIKVLNIQSNDEPPKSTFRIVKAGKGRSVKSSSTVTLNYSAALLNGKSFDKQEKLKIRASKLIPGFKQFVIGMKAGEERVILLPIGTPNPTGQFPPDQPIEVRVKLLAVK